MTKYKIVQGKRVILRERLTIDEANGYIWEIVNICKQNGFKYLWVTPLVLLAENTQGDFVQYEIKED